METSLFLNTYASAEKDELDCITGFPDCLVEQVFPLPFSSLLRAHFELLLELVPGVRSEMQSNLCGLCLPQPPPTDLLAPPQIQAQYLQEFIVLFYFVGGHKSWNEPFVLVRGSTLFGCPLCQLVWATLFLILLW